MYFSHAFRKTLLGVDNGSNAPLENTFTTVGTGVTGFTINTGSGLGTVTYSTTAAHGLVVGDSVTIAGITVGTAASIGSPNGSFIVTVVPTANSFTVVNSLQTATWASGGTVSKGVKTTSSLTAGQIGLFNKNFAAINTAQQATSEPFYLIQGSYYKQSGYSDIIGAHGGYQESVKSKLINPKYISRVFIVQAKAPVQQVVQIPLTAASGSSNVGLNPDTTYRLRIDVKGSPALRFLSHNIYRNLDSYTGPANATNSNLLKDPVATLLDWKEQLTMSPYFNQLVQARVYVYRSQVGTSTSTGIASWGNVGTGLSAQTLIVNSNNTAGFAVGQRVIGAGLPANSFVTAVASTATATHSATGVTITTSTYTATSGGSTFSSSPGVGAAVSGAGFPVGSYVSAYTSTTAFVITFPTQAVAPTISGTFTASISCTITYPTQATSPSSNLSTTSTYRFYNDVYGALGGYTVPYTNIAVTSGQQPTYVGQTPYIPGTSAYNTSGPTQTTGTATGATIAAASTVAAATSAAHVYQASADAPSFTTDAILELTAAYMETKFGNPTFTVTDNYDLEPLKIIASLMDDSGNTVVTAPIGTAATQAIGEAGIATVTQPSSQAQGTGETVLRELILTGKYRQEAFGDGTHIDQFRMREIEANPGVLNMMTVAQRNSLYHKVCVLHNVPRFNNPTTTFDNDQYLIEVAFPNTVTLANLLTANSFASYIVEAAQAAQGSTAIQLEII